jgi:limonene-1,2-epoxide hydrolase
MPDTPEQIVRTFYEAWDIVGFEAAFRNWFHPEGVWQNNGDPPRVGIDEIMDGVRAYLTMFQRPYATVEVVHLVADGDVVLTERIEHCVNRETNDVYTGHHMASFVLRGGKIARWTDYFDPSDYRNGNALPKPS